MTSSRVKTEPCIVKDLYGNVVRVNSVVVDHITDDEEIRAWDGDLVSSSARLSTRTEVTLEGPVIVAEVDSERITFTALQHEISTLQNLLVEVKSEAVDLATQLADADEAIRLLNEDAATAEGRFERLEEIHHPVMGRDPHSRWCANQGCGPDPWPCQTAIAAGIAVP